MIFNKNLILLILALLVISGALYLANRELKHFKSEVKEAVKYSKTQDKPVYTINQDSQTIATKKILETNLSSFQLLFQKQADELERKFDVKLRKMSGYYEAMMGLVDTASGRLKDTIVVVQKNGKLDTVQAKTFRYDDGYFKINCLIIDSNYNCPYTYQDTLTEVETLERLNWYQFAKLLHLRKRQSETKTTLSNKKAIILNVNRVKIVSKK